MKTTLASLVLLGIVALNTIAQDSTQWGLPEGAKARLGKGRIYELKYSPDGTRVAAPSSTGIWLYDAATGDPVSLMRLEDGFAGGSVAFSPDSRMLTSFSDVAHIWDAATGELSHTVRAEFGSAWYVAFSPDGRTLAVGAHAYVNLWDAVTGELKHTLSGERFGDVQRLAFSPDDRTLAIGYRAHGLWHSSGYGTLRLWDAATGELKYEQTENVGLPTSLVFSPDGRTVAVGGAAGAPGYDTWGWVTLWDAATGEFKRQLMPNVGDDRHIGRINSLAFSPDGRTLAIGRWMARHSDEEFGTVRFWDTETGAPTLTLEGHVRGVYGLALSPDGGTLAVASEDGRFTFWDTATGTLKRQAVGHSGSISRVAFSPDGGTVASGSWLAEYGGLSSTVHLWDAVTGTYKYTLAGHRNSITSIAFSPVGRTLASGSKDYTVRLWDAHTGMRIRTLTGYADRVNMIAYSPDVRMIAGANYSEIRLWDADTGVLKHTLEGGSRVAFSRDSRTLAAVRGGKIHLWDVLTGMQKGTLEVPAAAISYIAFTRDGRTLAIGRWVDPYSKDGLGTLRLWDAVTGENIRTLEGHTGDVYSVALSADGRTLASASRDGTVLLWDIAVDADIPAIKGDINQDGVVNIQDLVLVATQLGQTGPNIADANGDGIVHILDLVLVAGELGNEAGAPSIYSDGVAMFSPSEVKQWLHEARELGLEDVTTQRGIRFLESLLAAFTPRETALLPNFPNPFNPETWIPYQLATDSDVHISIFDSKGVLVRQLDLGLQPAGFYTDRGRAAYWDGRNEHAETVASGVYFYQLRAAEYTHMRRMVVVK